LQDHNADILFDDDGYALEGSTYFSLLNDKIKSFEELPNGSQHPYKQMVVLISNLMQLKTQMVILISIRVQERYILAR
jgi:hypothetical protein